MTRRQSFWCKTKDYHSLCESGPKDGERGWCRCKCHDPAQVPASDVKPCHPFCPPWQGEVAHA